MSYQVLARKWRPRTFEQMVGQEHVLRVLVNALNQQRLHQAYLFTGTRGVGKTTLARIFAKCLNCEVKISATPCGSCPACLAMDSGQFLDFYEIDAASRTKVEDTRDLLENTAYSPVQGRYKVYLIDEVHMLSAHSFNALLKTLEEPPPQVIFIFATTEPKKLPITILSRCLQLHLKQIFPKQITEQLKHICASEHILYEEPALVSIAQAAEGSLRDALSLLDQAIAFCPTGLKSDDIRQMLGYLSQDQVLRLLGALALHDAQGLFEILTVLHQRAPDYQQIIAELLSVLHQAALVQLIPSQEVNAAIKELAQQFSPEVIQLYYQIALLGRKDLAYTPSPAQGFEMIMLRMLAFRPASAAPDEILSFSQQKARPASTAAKNIAPSVHASNENKHEKIIQKEKQVIAPIVTESLNWRQLLAKLELAGLAQALALNCDLKKITDNQVELILPVNYKPMLNQKLLERIEQALSSYFNKTMHLTIDVTPDSVDSPAKQQEAEEALLRASALASLQQDPAVQKIQSLFNAKLDFNSIEVNKGGT